MQIIYENCILVHTLRRSVAIEFLHTFRIFVFSYSFGYKLIFALIKSRGLLRSTFKNSLRGLSPINGIR